MGVIESLGVEIRCGQRIGNEIDMEALQNEYDAVLLAIGLHLGRSTRIPGSDHPQVAKAIDLLRAITAGEEIDVPKQAVVIGGGNVAMDIARSLARLQKQQYGEVRMTLTALEDLDHFLADAEEVTESGEEGVDILDARGPQEILTDGDRVTGLKTWKVNSIFDAQGCFAPSCDESDEQIHQGELVIEAIGQAADVSILGEALTEALN